VISRVTVDVVDLERVARIRGADGEVAERRVLHPSEREVPMVTIGSADRRLGASLAIKEAWVKSRTVRPPDWSFEQTSVASVESVPACVRVVVDRFAWDLDLTAVETSVLDADTGPVWACHGLVGRWLIAAVIT